MVMVATDMYGKRPLWEWIREIMWTNAILTFMFICLFLIKRSVYSVDNSFFELYIVPILSFYILRFILLFLEELYHFNPIQDGHFQGCSRMGCSLKSVTHILQWWNFAHLHLTYRRSKKYINHVIYFLSSADISIFSPEISKFCCIKKYRYRLHFDK